MKWSWNICTQAHCNSLVQCIGAIHWCSLLVLRTLFDKLLMPAVNYCRVRYCTTQRRLVILASLHKYTTSAKSLRTCNSAWTVWQVFQKAVVLAINQDIFYFQIQLWKYGWGTVLATYRLWRALLVNALSNLSKNRNNHLFEMLIDLGGLLMSCDLILVMGLPLAVCETTHLYFG